MSHEQQLRSTKALRKLLELAEQHQLPDVTWILPSVGKDLVGHCVPVHTEQNTMQQRAAWEAWLGVLRPDPYFVTMQRSSDSKTSYKFKIENYEGLCDLVMNAEIQE